MNNIEKAISAIGYKPFATIITKRESWNKNGFHLDFDEVDDLNYKTLEVERGIFRT